MGKRATMGEYAKGAGALTGQLKVTHKQQDSYLARGIKLTLDGAYLTILKNGEDIVADVEPGRHLLLIDNTLHTKTVEFDVRAGEQAHYRIWNKRGFGSWMLDIFGSGPMYLVVERSVR
jgi:hypothetical protein